MGDWTVRRRPGARVAAPVALAIALAVATACTASHAAGPEVPSTPPAGARALDAALVTRAELGAKWYTQQGTGSASTTAFALTNELCPKAAKRRAAVEKIEATAFVAGPQDLSFQGAFWTETIESAADAPAVYAAIVAGMKDCLGATWTDLAHVRHAVAALSAPPVGDQSFGVTISFGQGDIETDTYATVVRRGHTVALVHVTDAHDPMMAGDDYTLAEYAQELHLAATRLPA
jgi:hypothetical protein